MMQMPVERVAFGLTLMAYASPKIFVRWCTILVQAACMALIRAKM